MPRLKEATRSARRQELIDAAWRSIAHKGWQDLTVDDVCAEAGVSKGAFYGYFEPKQDLLLALLDDEGSGFVELLATLGSDGRPAAEQLRQLVRQLVERAANPGRVQLRADMWATLSTDPAVRDRFAATVAGQRAVLRSLIERGSRAGELVEVPANALASILLALTEGLLLHGGLDPAAFKWTNVHRAVDAVLDGIQGR
jgi:AcrR family transcriptional regulator